MITRTALIVAVTAAVFIGNVHQNVSTELYSGGESNVHQNVFISWVLSRSLGDGGEALAGEIHGDTALGVVLQARRANIPSDREAGESPVTSRTTEAEQFLKGYRDAVGQRESEVLLMVGGPTDRCPTGESNWDRFAVSPSGHLGLAQFTARSWAGAGGGDWTDPYTQGRNVAVWSELTVPSEQWSCWP